MSLTRPKPWMFVLLFIPIIRNTLFIRGLDSAKYTTIDFWGLIDIVAIMLCAAVVLKNSNRIPWRKLFHSYMAFWMFYYVFCLFSIFWSAPGSSPAYIIYRAVCMLVMSLYVFFLVSNYNDREVAFKGMLKVFVVILLLEITKHIRVGDLHTNTYSATGAVIFMLAYASLRMKIFTFLQIKWFLALGLTGVILGTSSGSNIAFMIGLLLLICSNRYNFSLLKFFSLLFMAYLSYDLMINIAMPVLFPGKSIEGIQSASGRIGVWETYINAWKEQPWLGYGFSVGERAGEALGYIYTLSAHNGFISVLINTGILGCIIFGIFLLRFLYALTVSFFHGNGFSYCVLIAMIVLLVNNLSVPIIGSIWGILPTLVLFLISFSVLFLNTNHKDSVSHVI